MVDVTFAIPCHNGARHLRPLLESLLAQREVAVRLVLVDDASTDGSSGLAKHVAGDRIEIVSHDPVRGIPGNWNRAAELVDTEFFCLAHQDDVYAPDYAATLTAALAAQPAAAAAYCRVEAIDGVGLRSTSLSERYKERFWRQLGPSESPEETFKRLFAGNYVSCPSLLYRTDAFLGVGMFDVDYRFVADWEWLLRASAKGFTLVPVARQLVSYRRHAAQATKQAVTSLRRYREEHELLRHAAAVGASIGLWPPTTRSTAMRDNLLYDAFGDLEAGDRHAAEAKLELLAELDPEARKSLPARVLVGAARSGAVGRAALRFGLTAYVGMAARRG